MSTVSHEIRKRLVRGESRESIRSFLLERGYSEAEIDQHFRNVRGTLNLNKLFYKEFFDRVGYGFGSQQYISILFYLIGAPLFLIGMLNGTKVFLSGVLASLINTFRGQYKKILCIAALVVGFSFIVLAYSLSIGSLWLFFLAAVIGALAVIPYGDIYQRIFKGLAEHERKMYLLNHLTTLGGLVTIISMLAAAIILDKFPVTGKVITLPLLGRGYAYGYLIVFEVAAMAFIISGLLAYFLASNEKSSGFGHGLHETVSSLRHNWRAFSSNRVLLTFLVAGAVTSIVNALGNAFYGLFIYKDLGYVGFGGFANVAVIFMIGIVAGLLAPRLTRMNSLHYGKFPMLLFGTLLMAILPLSYYYKPNLLSIAIGTIIGIFGGAIVGTAQGLLILDVLKEEERMSFFRFNSSVTVLPYIIGIPLGCLAVQSLGMQNFFLILSLTLVVVVVPIYLSIILMQHKKERV
jgi:MFS family permease